MNNSGSVPPTTPSLHTAANATEVASETTLSTTLHTHKATIIEVTTAAPPRRRLCGDRSGHCRHCADVGGSGLPALPVSVPQQRRLQDNGGAGAGRGPR
nr:uncharacterized protein LOC105416291 isoform X2 [Takifugu rubripes]